MKYIPKEAMDIYSKTDEVPSIFGLLTDEEYEDKDGNDGDCMRSQLVAEYLFF